LLLAKAFTVPHHGFMNECKDAELGMRLLPGVDLALWLRLVVLAVFVAVAAGVGIAAF
jgi:hypothetical protein